MGRGAVTHCPRLPHSPGTAIESQHAGAWRNTCSGLPAVLAGVPPKPPLKIGQQGWPTLTWHQQKANEQRWKTKTWGAGQLHPASHPGCSSIMHVQQRAVSRGERQYVATSLLAVGTQDPCPHWRASKGTRQMLPMPRRHR